MRNFQIVNFCTGIKVALVEPIPFNGEDAGRRGVEETEQDGGFRWLMSKTKHIAESFYCNGQSPLLPPLSVNPL